MQCDVARPNTIHSIHDGDVKFNWHEINGIDVISWVIPDGVEFFASVGFDMPKVLSS